MLKETGCDLVAAGSIPLSLCVMYDFTLKDPNVANLS